MTVDPHLVALLGLPALGPRRLRLLLDAFDPAAAWDAVAADRLDGIPLGVAVDKRSTLTKKWREAAAEVDVDGVLADHARAGVRILGPDDPEWPAAFAADPEPPPVLFVRGDAGLLGVSAVAIVGTRRCTAAGLATARELGHDLADAGVGVVSGLALGIDGAAHRGCLDGGGRPVGVVATGIDVVYPTKHARLWKQVASAGVLVSEAPLGTAGERWRFPARNRLIAALGLVVIVVESRRRGGSMHTVAAAIDRDTDVLAVPGPVRSPASAGPNQLLHEGCGVVRDAEDVLVALGTRVPRPGQLSLVGGGADVRGAGPGDDDAGDGDGVGGNGEDDGDVGLDDNGAPVGEGRDGAGEDPVAAAVSWHPCPLDEVVAAAGLPFTEVAARLARLELDGVVERVPDGYQRRVVT